MSTQQPYSNKSKPRNIPPHGTVYFLDRHGRHENRVRNPGWGPKKAGDVGYDLHVVVKEEDQNLLDRIVSWVLGMRMQILLPLVGTRVLSSGVHLDMSDDYWAEIRPRSSTSRKKLMVLGGTLDSGYQGELYTVLHNFGFIPRIVINDERYAQVVFHQAVRPKVEWRPDGVGLVRKSDRADTGFGSTGA